MNTYDDTDDDDELSDISERSHEEDVSEPIANKNSQSTLEKKDKPSSDSLQSPTSGVFTPASTLNTTERTSEPQGLTSSNSEISQQKTLPSSPDKSVVKARRLEQSDSEDTTSASDTQLNRQSGTDTFYSPDQSVDEGDDTENQHASTLRQSQQKQQTNVNQNKANQQKNQDDTEEDEDSGSNTDSAESEEDSAHDGRMALGEPYISNQLGSLRSKY